MIKGSYQFIMKVGYFWLEYRLKVSAVFMMKLKYITKRFGLFRNTRPTADKQALEVDRADEIHD